MINLSSKTKIIATVGPSCDREEVLEKMIFAGARIFRFNSKHNTLDWHQEKINLIKKLSKKLEMVLTTLIDLQGSEIRIGHFDKEKETFEKNEIVYFASKKINNLKTIILDEKILEKINSGQKIFIADGNLEFEVIDKNDKVLKTKVIEGGEISGNKNTCFPGLKLNLQSITEKDKLFIDLAVKTNVDYLALSFVRTKNDILDLKNILKKNSSKIKIISKIETQEAIENIDEIIKYSDAIMVARGDLGVQLPIEKVPFYQKLIIKKCLDQGKPVITATQMLESMIENKRPTRAEVSDIANAIYDGTSAIMLSGETANGRYPIKAVETMNKVANFIEKNHLFIFNSKTNPNNLTEQIVYAAYKLVEDNLTNIKAIVVFTETGKTVHLISKYKPSLSIYTFTQKENIKSQINLLWGVYPFFLTEKTKIVPVQKALIFLKEKKFLNKGDKVIAIYGDHYGKPGNTNTIKIEEIK